MIINYSLESNKILEVLYKYREELEGIRERVVSRNYPIGHITNLLAKKIRDDFSSVELKYDDHDKLEKDYENKWICGKSQKEGKYQYFS